MTKSQLIRWGILGCGNVTEKKSGPAYQQVEGFELTAVMRRTLSKAQDYAERHEVPFFTDLADELIHREDVDAVYIATPPDSHASLALQVAEAGKICCIEKPITHRVADAEELVQTFTKKDLPLFVAYYRRTLPRFEKVKELLEDGCIGEMRHVQMTHLQPSQDNGWRTDQDVAPGGLFEDLGSHELDLITWLLGPVSKASGISLNQQGLYTAKDAVSGSWLHKNGITGSGVWNFGSQQRKDEVQIHGSEATVIFSVFSDHPIQIHSESGTSEIRVDHPDTIQLPHVQAMADALFHGKPHPSTGETALHTAWVMDQILR